MSRRGLLLVAVIAIAWAVGLYPYEWSLPFTVHRNGAVANDGLAFAAPGIARAAAPPDWVNAVVAGAVLELILDVQPASTAQNGRLLTLSRDETYRNLSIGQNGDALSILLGRPRTRLNRQFRYTVPDVFTRAGAMHIELALGDGRLAARVDGESRPPQDLPRIWARKWDPDYRLALGNELTFARPWLGRITAAEVRTGDTREDLLDGRLETPPVYFAVRQPVRYELVPFTARPFAERERDVLINLLGFVPIGLLFALAANGRRSTALLGCLLLSASIEAGQFFLAARVPSSTDLVFNTLGGALGVLASFGFRSPGRT